MLTVKELLSWGIDYLKQNGVKGYRLDAEVVLRYILNLDDVDLILNYNLVPLPNKASLFQKLLSERAEGRPVAYLVSHKEFMGLDFAVNQNVLIPRPETELMVEAILKELGDKGDKLVVDLGTGSGCIGISLAKLGGHQVHAIDESLEAIEVAKGNSLRHNVSELVSFHCGNLFEPIRELKLDGKIDAVVSNPPYIPTGDLEALQVEIREHEPLIALNGGIKGTDFHSKIISQAGEFLKAEGTLVLEIGLSQAEEVCRLIEGNKTFSSPKVTKDYSGIERVVVGKKKK